MQDMAETELPVAALNASRANTSFNGGLFLLALLAALYVGHEIVVPVVLALILKLVLHPVSRFLQRLYIPRALAAALIILSLIGGFGALATLLSKPAVAWAEKIPVALPKLEDKLEFLSGPIESFEQFLSKADNATAGNAKVVAVAVTGNRLSDKLLTGTSAMLGGTFTTLLVLFFLMVSGDTFLRRFVEILPRFQDKRQAVDISQQIERDISAYLVTITVMNLLVGGATGLAMFFCDVGDPILWGTLAFLLNYIPIVGPLIGIGTFFLIGLITQSTLMTAAIPALFYFLVHMVESSGITPHLLARRFTLNPVLVILSLIFWFWMWGIPGAVLAVPILAIMKIICDRIASLQSLGHFIEG